MVWLMAVNLCVLLVVSAFTVDAWLGARDRFDPLGDYPTQQILNETVSDVPTLTLLEDVIVEGIKCSNETRPVQVSGVTTWVSVEPPGSIIQVGEGTALRNPGCEEFVFVNPIPPDVADRTLELFRDGLGSVEWRITGIETPIREDGKRGEPRTWTTEPFLIIDVST